MHPVRSRICDVPCRISPVFTHPRARTAGPGVLGCHIRGEVLRYEILDMFARLSRRFLEADSLWPKRPSWSHRAGPAGRVGPPYRSLGTVYTRSTISEGTSMDSIRPFNLSSLERRETPSIDRSDKLTDKLSNYFMVSPPTRYKRNQPVRRSGDRRPGKEGGFHTNAISSRHDCRIERERR